MAYIDNVTNILQIQPDGLPTFVRLSQNENGRNLYFQLAGNEIDIPANATITISGTKPDGTVYSGTGSISDNVILIPEMIQMTAVAGYWDAKVKIISGGNTIATGRIRFVIDADTVDPDSVPSDSELEGLVAEAQQYAETARTEAYGSPLTAQTVAGMTDHTRVYVYTGSESGYTAGHWYFWNGSAWTDGGIYNSTAVNTDTTLTLAGVAADAKATGDAIEAARVAIDDTLTNEGEAADAAAVGSEISGLKEDLNLLDGQINGTQSGDTRDLKPSAEWTDGYTIDYSNGGRVNSASGSFATISLDGISHISGYTRGGLETTRGIAFCKADGTWISGSYNQGASSYDWNYDFDVPSGAEIVKISCSTSYKNAFTCIGILMQNGGIVGEISDINTKIGDIGDLATQDKANLVNAINETYAKTSENSEPDGYESLEMDVDGLKNAVGYKYDEQYLEVSAKKDGYYWIKNGNEIKLTALSGMSAYNKVFVPSGTYFSARISGANTFIQKVDDPTDIKTKSSLTPNTDGSYTIAYDFYLYASHSNSDGAEGYWATTTLTLPIIEGRYNVTDDITALKSGNTVKYTGSWNQVRTGNFVKGSYWRIKLLEYAQSSGIEFKGLPDASDTSTYDYLFTIKQGEEYLWSPLKNYEAIRYGANGASAVEINDCTSIYDELERKVFYCGASREFTKLVDAINAAEEYMGSILYVDAGTYDLVQEGVTASTPGIVLKNRIHIIFSPNSRVICHYQGDDTNILTNFSPFNCGQFGFTIENLNLDSSRTRYAIHDERNGKAEQCISHYINCNIKQDNSQNASWASYCCIGGGLGANHEVIVENCTFESIAREGTVVHGSVSYHPSNDNSNTDFACEVVVKDNYFKTGTLEISGSRTDALNDTNVIVTGNSFEYHAANAPSGIYYSGNQTYQGTHYNIMAWNNEIRQSA